MRNIFFGLVLLFTLSLNSQAQENNVNQLLEQKKYTEAAALLEKEYKDRELVSDDLFFLAKVYAQANNLDSAISKLYACLDVGYLDLDRIAQSGVFDKIMEHEKFELFVNDCMDRKQELLESIPKERKFLDTLDLPNPVLKGKVSVEEALANRRSVRQYEDKEIDLNELSQILWAAYGITKPLDREGARGGYRTAPSAGAKYPLEIYVVAGKVTGLEAGVYYYNSQQHELYLMKKGDLRQKLPHAAYGQKMLAEAPASILFSADYSRTTGKYKKRGKERYVCMDLGHSAENVYLQCEALGLATCAVGSFIDLEVKVLIGVVRKEVPLYIMPLGKEK